MAFRLGDYIICGELWNDRPYSTFGALQLAGMEDAISIQLTGDCDADLKGRHFRFEAVPDPSQCSKPKLKEFRKATRALALMQVGPTGTMTAAGWVKTFDCSVKEFLRRSKLGEAPPTRWARRLYLEWFSQNGRVVIELAGPVIEVFEDGEWKPLPHPGPSPDEIEQAQEAAGLPPAAGLEIDIISATGEIKRLQFPDDEHAPPEEKAGPGDDADDLQRQLDEQAAAVERAIRGEEPPCDAVEAAMLMDHALDTSIGSLLVDIFEPARRFPAPDSLDDKQVEIAFKNTLMQLAMCGIAFHVCPHCTPREAYRLLLGKVMKEERVFRPLMKTGWVQFFDASEYCAKCEEEFEARHQANEENEEQGGGGGATEEGGEAPV